MQNVGIESPPGLHVQPETSTALTVETPESLPAVANVSTTPPANVDDFVSPRWVFEFFILLTVACSLFRDFVAEAYLVPSGSMAPTLLGFHKKAQCPHCGEHFEVGVDENGSHSGAIDCPNCSRRVVLNSLPISTGDRLLVQKGIYDLRQPSRWETVVFRNPAHPRQAYVKRVVGLPGEQIQVFAGDIYINGQIARKTFDVYRDLSLPVFDHAACAIAGVSAGQWVAESSTGWSVVDDHLEFRPPTGNEEPRVDYLWYRHQNAAGAETDLQDIVAYNGDWPAWHHHSVTDLTLELSLFGQGGDGFVEIICASELRHRFVLRLQPATGVVQLWQNSQKTREAQIAPWDRRKIRVVVGMVDQAVHVRIDGVAPFASVELDNELERRRWQPGGTSRPFAIGSAGFPLNVKDIVIRRDVYYSIRGANAMSAGSDAGTRLADDEYYMLGDNSPISNDSRVWDRPAVPGSLLIGKPVIVYLPSRTWQWTLLGRQFRWSVPDIGNIRIVH